jgi:hypothetical protein
MTSWVTRIANGIRVWLGWGDLSSERLTPGHGWLLPRQAEHGSHAPAAGASRPAHAKSLFDR